ncbi:MAG TPA: YceI family protein [Sphingobium sp.]
MKPIHLCAALLAFVAAPVFAQPTSWTVDKAQSSVGFSGKHAGSDFNGKFGTWDATILFDPADLAHSSAKVTFQTGTAKTGNEMEDEALGQEEWLNPAKFPTATFTSTQITSAGGNNYVAKGMIALKGKTLPATLNFTLTISGNSATMRGSSTVDRLAYDIGTVSDANGTFVSKDIGITVDLVAKK